MDGHSAPAGVLVRAAHRLAGAGWADWGDDGVAGAERRVTARRLHPAWRGWARQLFKAQPAGGLRATKNS